jgi:very-short-patch-repair endonuclease
MKLESLRDLADANQLLIYDDLVPLRLTRSAWTHAHSSGLLVRIHQGVSRLADAPVTPELLIAAAVAGARPTAGEHRVLAAGRTAAFLMGVDVPPGDPIHVTVKGRTHRVPLVGVKIHRPRNHLDLLANDAADAIPRTRLVRALLDVAAWDPHLTSTVLEQMIVKKLITIRDAESAVRRHSKQGRPGLKVLRETVEAWGLRQRPPDSVLEARFAKLRKEFDLPEFEFQRPVGRYRADFCRPIEMLIVECVGFRDHGRRQEQIERDNERKAELTADGWLVMEFSWHQINNRSAWVASRIRRTLMQRAAQPRQSADLGR